MASSDWRVKESLWTGWYLFWDLNSNKEPLIQRICLGCGRKGGHSTLRELLYRPQGLNMPFLFYYQTRKSGYGSKWWSKRGEEWDEVGQVGWGQTIWDSVSQNRGWILFPMSHETICAFKKVMSWSGVYFEKITPTRGYPKELPRWANATTTGYWAPEMWLVWLGNWIFNFILL